MFSRLFFCVVSRYCSFFSRLVMSDFISSISEDRRFSTVLMGVATNLNRRRTASAYPSLSSEKRQEEQGG